MTTPMKTIVVCGATGKQGGSIIWHLLECGTKYRIRGLVRDMNHENARKFKDKGVELFTVDWCKPETLDAPLKDADVFFILTDSYEKTQLRDEEYKTGMKLVDAAIKHRVSHIIYSTLPNVEKVTNGKWDVPHFTNKAKVEEYIRGKKGSFKHITFVAPGFYFQNFLDFDMVRFDGKELRMCLPMKEDTMLPGIDIWDMGKVFPEILRKPDDWHDKVIPICAEKLPLREYMRIMGEGLKLPVKLEYCSVDDWVKNNEKRVHIAREFGNMLGYFCEYDYFGNESKYGDIFLGKKLAGDKGFHTFKEWLDRNKDDSRWRRTQGAAHQ